MSGVRAPDVAGLFYPGDAKTLRRDIDGFLSNADADAGDAPKALIVPHAGYAYSGPVAATGYKLFEAVRDTVRRVVLLGPAHRYPLRGLASHTADSFETPLGRIPVDRAGVPALDAAHKGEHSLEVHLPFLQTLFESFTLVPVLVGEATPDEVADVLDRLWGGDETRIVISSDLSHFHDYDTARKLDAETANAIEELRAADVRPEDACGCRAIAGLLVCAKRRGLRVAAIDLRNSGDTAGPRNEVVGYGSFAVT